MGAQLPAIPEVEFIENLKRESPVPLSASVLQMLWSHYEELRRWNPGLSLVGPGTAVSVMTRHYGESLAGLALLDEMGPCGGVLVDLGSGGGFPGFVLAREGLGHRDLDRGAPAQMGISLRGLSAGRCGERRIAV